MKFLNEIITEQKEIFLIRQKIVQLRREKNKRNEYYLKHTT